MLNIIVVDEEEINSKKHDSVSLDNTEGENREEK